MPPSEDQQTDELKKAYDAVCKKVLAEKGIIANILKSCVKEFEDSSIDEIVHHCIQGTPEVGTVLVEPDAGITRIQNVQTEDKSSTEGTVFYDIRFTALAPADGQPIELIINIEAQNDFNPGYPLLKRAIYYCSRLISSQYGTVFTKSHYEKIQKVYSIWICTAPTKAWSYTITRYSMKEENLIGQAEAPNSDYDLLTPILVCLGKKHYTELTGLLKMLNLVLLDNISSDSKVKTLSEEFKVTTTPHLEKGVAKMCNLSEGIEKRGISIGKAEGISIGKAEGISIGETRGETRGIVRSIKALMRKSGLTIDAAMDILDVPEADRPRYAEIIEKGIH
ncbi:MAG: hypothetical protein ACI4OH_09190 [Mitsuokella sp.]|uniref:hypothetical protein n=1 Tax=Mitsuokella sp. TaxID=2049034 RepID=UPI003F0183D8